VSDSGKGYHCCDLHLTVFNIHCNCRYATLAFAVAELGVNHVIVLGHYGCGGVQAAMRSLPEAPIDAAQGVVQAWIEPIRGAFHHSVRYIAQQALLLKIIIFI
jgi:carbonic anhydrase